MPEFSDEAQALAEFLLEAAHEAVSDAEGTAEGPLTVEQALVMATWLLGAGIRLPNSWIPDRQTRELQEASDATKPPSIQLEP
jgi:hypothetical protein